MNVQQQYNNENHRFDYLWWLFLTAISTDVSWTFKSSSSFFWYVRDNQCTVILLRIPGKSQVTSIPFMIVPCFLDYAYTRYWSFPSHARAVPHKPPIKKRKKKSPISNYENIGNFKTTMDVFPDAVKVKAFTTIVIQIFRHEIKFFELFFYLKTSYYMRLLCHLSRS